MKTTATNTITGLVTYFIDDLMYAHRSSYPANMTREQFAAELEAYREGMNDHNSCSFPQPSERSINAMFKSYVAETAARA